MNLVDRVVDKTRTTPLIVRLVVGVLAIQVCAFAGAVVAELVPDARVAHSLATAIRTGDLTAAEYGRSPSGRQVDHFTECITLTEGLGDPEGTTPFETAATSPDLGQCSKAVPKLIEFERTGGFAHLGTYFRYWHGYAVITRPALATVGLGGARAISLFLVVAGLIGVWLMARTRFGPWVATAFTLPAILTADVLEVHASIPHAIAWACAFGSAMLAMALLGPNGRAPRISLGWCVAVGIMCGSLVAYFDLMIAMAANVCFLLTLTVLFVQQRHGASSGWVKAAGAVVASGSGWLIGLATTWVSKWLIAAAVLGADTVADNVKHQVGFRINGESQYAPGGFGSALRSNFSVWTDSRLVDLVLVITAVALVVWTVRAHQRGTFRPVTLLLYAAVSLSVPVWFELLSSHSQIHSWLTYRSLAASVSALIIGVIQATRPPATAG